MDRETMYGVLNDAMNRIQRIKDTEIGAEKKLYRILKAAVEEVLEGCSDIEDQYSLPDDDEFLPEVEDLGFVSD